eukprot:gnl/TRDRNA2_/TRDRNA2_186327_c0_seq1.p1 gnl/TRDRNA2_/TRDRNA2_186327_c0~~gnl/TRDRNA2_/TRDRNA2_186327_c0_seq1.p1  ORF type:complete len:842 (+),score=131.44 gnl/TRDRNA2_/TRDRNA2_186327_c0_seq1:81-2528(+)
MLDFLSESSPGCRLAAALPVLLLALATCSWDDAGARGGDSEPVLHSSDELLPKDISSLFQRGLLLSKKGSGDPARCIGGACNILPSTQQAKAAAGNADDEEEAYAALFQNNLQIVHRGEPQVQSHHDTRSADSLQQSASMQPLGLQPQEEEYSALMQRELHLASSLERTPASTTMSEAGPALSTDANCSEEQLSILSPFQDKGRNSSDDVTASARKIDTLLVPLSPNSSKPVDGEMSILSTNSTSGVSFSPAVDMSTSAKGNSSDSLEVPARSQKDVMPIPIGLKGGSVAGALLEAVLPTHFHAKSSPHSALKSSPEHTGRSSQSPTDGPSHISAGKRVQRYQERLQRLLGLADASREEDAAAHHPSALTSLLGLDVVGRASGDAVRAEALASGLAIDTTASNEDGDKSVALKTADNSSSAEPLPIQGGTVAQRATTSALGGSSHSASEQNMSAIPKQVAEKMDPFSREDRTLYQALLALHWGGDLHGVYFAVTSAVLAMIVLILVVALSTWCCMFRRVHNDMASDAKIRGAWKPTPAALTATHLLDSPGSPAEVLVARKACPLAEVESESFTGRRFEAFRKLLVCIANRGTPQPYPWYVDSEGCTRPTVAQIARQLGMKQGDKAAFTICGDIDPTRDWQKLPVLLVNPDGTQRNVGHVVIDEAGENPGIHIESRQGSLVAFLQVRFAAGLGRIILHAATASSEDGIEPIAVLAKENDFAGLATVSWYGSAVQDVSPEAPAAADGTPSMSMPPVVLKVMLDRQGQPGTMRFANGNILAVSLRSTGSEQLVQVGAAEDLWLAVVGIVASRRLALTS